MTQSRVLLAVDSPLYRGVLRRLVDREKDLILVGEVDDPVDLLVAVRRSRANVVIHTWPTSNEMPGICSHLLHEFPELLLIAIPDDADRVVTCRQTITVSEIADGGVDDVLLEIRRGKSSLQRVCA